MTFQNFDYLSGGSIRNNLISIFQDRIGSMYTLSFKPDSVGLIQRFE